MSRVGRGVMEVTIHETDYELKATIAAIEAIEQRFGDMANAAQACIKLSFSHAAFIISKGANLNKDETKKLKADIMKAGIETGAVIASDYLGMLLNPDGVEIDPDEEGDSGEE